MRTTSRLALASVIAGGGLLLGAPAALAQTAPYPFDRPTTGAGGSGTGGSTTPVSGGSTTPAQGGTTTPVSGGTVSPLSAGDTPPAAGAAPAAAGGSAPGTGSGQVGSAATLPLTGGELVLLTATGAAALVAGTVLTAVGRRRSIEA